MVPLAVPPGVDAGIDVRELSDLVSDAAERAWAMLAGDGASGLELSVGADVVRRAARGDVTRIAEQTGLDPIELAAAVAAWRVGGLAGFHVHRGRVDVAEEAMLPGRLALGARAKVRANTVSAAGSQLRLDEQGRWWRFRADDVLGWLLVDGPADDPADLLEAVERPTGGDLAYSSRRTMTSSSGLRAMSGTSVAGIG